MNQTTNLKDFLLLGLRGGSRLPYLANDLKKKKNCLFGCAVSWLALRVLSCDMRTLSCMCEILIPQPRTKPAPPALKGRFLTTGLIGKSLVLCPIRKLFQKKKRKLFQNPRLWPAMSATLHIVQAELLPRAQGGASTRSYLRFSPRVAICSSRGSS